MPNIRHTFWFLAASFLGAALLFGFLGQASPTENVTPQPNVTAEEFRTLPRKLSESDRRWHQTPTVKLGTLGEEDNATLYGPLRADTDNQGRLLVYDYGAARIKKISISGDIEVVFGAGRGQGPGEFLTVTDFGVSDKNHLWVADPVNGRITIFDDQGQLLHIIKTPQPVYRLGPIHDEQLSVMFTGGTKAFGLARFEENALVVRRNFGVFLEDQERNSLLLDGWLTGQDSDGFAFVSNRLNLIAGYTSSGEPRFLVETISKVDMPKIFTDGTDMKWLERGAPRNALAATSYGNELFVLGVLDWNSPILKGVIDVYSASSGQYLYSVLTPERCGSIVVTKDLLYTVDDTTIGIWKRSF